ncbi:MAG: hypothetical protein H8M99_03010, partial [Gloeobacteraceae cyanobacterium ES-bin-144]|nr:hypothetical protein [Verrucomicrobiales bacterium]
MLKIPALNDVPPPLVVPLRRAGPEPAAEADSESPGIKRRRRKKPGDSDHHSWEQQKEISGGRRGEGRQMRLMLIGGALLLSLILAGTIVLMKSGKATPVIVVKKAAAPTAAVSPTPEVRTEASFLTEAEPLARKFLGAASVEELLPLVRMPEIVGPRMKAFYADGKVTPLGLSLFNSGNAVGHQNNQWIVTILTRDHEEKGMVFIDSRDGLKIDWESFVGWSDMPWSEFIAKRPAQSHVFRVMLAAANYYNFAFSDESKWHCYRLQSPDREKQVFGYAEKGTELEKKLLPSPDQKEVELMLALKFPEGTTQGNQVEIVKIIAD